MCLLELSRDGNVKLFCVVPQRALSRTTLLLENQTPTEKWSETHHSSVLVALVVELH